MHSQVMMGQLPPHAWESVFHGDDGRPLVGGRLFSYEYRGGPMKNTYVDPALTLANVNPVALNDQGRAFVYLATGSYYFQLRPANPRLPNLLWDLSMQVQKTTKFQDGIETLAGKPLPEGRAISLKDL